MRWMNTLLVNAAILCVWSAPLCAQNKPGAPVVPTGHSLKQSTKPIEILPQLIAVRLKGIIELIAHPSDRLVKTHYSPKFMEQVPAAILVSMFQQVSLEATSCRMERVLELRDPLSAVVLLNCRGINAEALIAVDAKPPHQIVGFSMRPSPKPTTTPSP